MPLTVNLLDLETGDTCLEGDLPVAELDFDERDPMVRARQPLKYALTVQKLGQSLILKGKLELELDCECVRCLKEFKHTVRLESDLPVLELEGEEAVPVVADCVDLTGPLREHILLAFPPHPVCQPDCGGLSLRGRKTRETRTWTDSAGGPSPWDQLDRLKL